MTFIERPVQRDSCSKVFYNIISYSINTLTSRTYLLIAIFTVLAGQSFLSNATQISSCYMTNLPFDYNIYGISQFITHSFDERFVVNELRRRYNDVGFITELPPNLEKIEGSLSICPSSV